MAALATEDEVVGVEEAEGVVHHEVELVEVGGHQEEAEAVREEAQRL